MFMKSNSVSTSLFLLIVPRFLGLLSFLVSLIGPSTGFTADSFMMKTLNVAENLAYWTPERFKNAKPMPLPQVDIAPEQWDTAEAPVLDSTAGEEFEARPPTVKVRPVENNGLFERLYYPDPVRQSMANPPEDAPPSSEPVERENVGTAGAHFTSSRLVPLSADRSFPYKAVGQLSFTMPSGEGMCSGAVIKPRIILTAGHCVHSGNGSLSGFYTNFRFAPAFRDGVAPFGTWIASAVLVTTTWATGGGIFPNAADYAVIEVQDQLVGGVLKRIGDVTGAFGVKTLSLPPNHAHLLGHPGNLDNGMRMHQVTAQSFSLFPNNTVLYGSDMREGSSGGPWVQNFGALAAGQTGGLNAARNRIIGVTSFGFTDPNPKTQGSSILDSRFTSILNTICGLQAGNC
jgi:V8-like Glu-specific endopeptidase